MPAVKTDGNCYICGKTLGKTPMKNHILKEHSAGDEDSLLLKIEGAYLKEYWLFADIAKSKTLNTLDTFLRKIWLECCGHLSGFRAGRYDEISKTRKMSAFSKGDTFVHEYDMGTTTECLITVVGETTRPKQRNSVRLLARNIAPVFKCDSCGKPAEFICQYCMYQSDNPNYCGDCASEHTEYEHGDDYMMRITNSPRSGQCGYDGEMDTFVFDPEKFR